jgi:two-component sensor histidine kinase
VAGTRTWTDEAMELFGLTLADRRGRVGGDADEFNLALHPDDRHLPQSFYELAHRQDWYPVEYRILRPDGTIRWVSGGGQVVSRGKDGKAQRLVNVVTDITGRKLAEEHIKLLMNELSHRAKNLLAVVLSIATQTRRTAGTFDEFLTRFTQRLQGLAASHDLLALQDWQGASLTDLVRDQLAPFVEAGSARLSVSGSSIFLGPKAAEAIGLALHELATNAVKYGALSSPAGRVTVSWDWKTSATEPRLLQMSWEERGGPPVSLPTSKGFGHVVFGRIVTEILDGKVEMDFASEGLNWKLLIPTRNLVTEQAAARDWFASPARLSERRTVSD